MLYFLQHINSNATTMQNVNEQGRGSLMAVNDPLHINEGGLPLNAIEWLETHHRSKLPEREQMIRDIHFKQGSHIVDAGCGPGLWTPVLARAIGYQGQILGVDISPEALVTAHKRAQGKWYESIVKYKRSLLEQLPVAPSSLDLIFSANVSQYLPEPVSTFAAMGSYLVPGGRLVIKDIDFGTMRFHTIDPSLQARVYQARERWEGLRVDAGYPFEDSWVGSKLAGYMRLAGFEEVQEKSYRIVRHTPLSNDFRIYLQGIAEWFVCEGAPLLKPADRMRWLQHFEEGSSCTLDVDGFMYEETEYVVTGKWNKKHSTARHFDMYISILQEVLV
jgi:ubiquinone/menaquinone biosynthesis C-methylase UbiE